MSKSFELLQINTDGGSRGNPGPAAIGVIAKANDQTVFTLSEKIGLTTNNVAEYTAVLKAVEKIISAEITVEKIRFVLDSELIVKQITGQYKIKQPHLLALKTQISDLVAQARSMNLIHQVTFTHVLRVLNKEADKLVNEALDQ